MRGKYFLEKIFVCINTLTFFAKFNCAATRITIAVAIEAIAHVLNLTLKLKNSLKADILTA